MFWKQNTATKNWEPTQYPSDIDVSDLVLPSIIQTPYHQLNSSIETKYYKEYLKMCAYYNKAFPSLKSFDWTLSMHNAVPFTYHEQERYDGSTGISTNYLKNAIDKVTSRIASLQYFIKVQAATPSIILEMYKDSIEKYFRKVLKASKIVVMTTEVFHDAAILGFGHVFMNPWTDKVEKINDWEFGCYGSEFNNQSLKRVLIRDFAFPVTSLKPYINKLDKDVIKDIVGSKTQVDLQLYIDTIIKKAYCTIDAYTLDPIDYPFDEVQVVSYSWDIGVKRTMVTSLFDILYPIQRSINKLNAKKTQLIENYKGPVPVFGNDCDIIVKSMGNGAGEALFIDSGRSPVDVVTVINPMPLDPEMNAEIEMFKTAMQELAGAQELSLDMENIRSAATVIALEQLHDQRFQSQLTLLSAFVSDIMEMILRYNVVMERDVEDVPYGDIKILLDECVIVTTAMKTNDPENNTQDEPNNLANVLCNRACVALMRGDKQWSDVADDCTLDAFLLRNVMANMYMKLQTTNNEEYKHNLMGALMGAFVDDVMMGNVTI